MHISLSFTLPLGVFAGVGLTVDLHGLGGGAWGYFLVRGRVGVTRSLAQGILAQIVGVVKGVGGRFLRLMGYRRVGTGLATASRHCPAWRIGLPAGGCRSGGGRRLRQGFTKIKYLGGRDGAGVGLGVARRRVDG